MKIKLHNIGIVDSTICLDGLTVITGENNSGKTTVGKVLYSLIDAVSNMEDRARRDKKIYINRRLDDVARTLQLSRVYRHQRSETMIEEMFGEDSAFKYLLRRESRRDRSHGETEPLEQLAYKLLNELATVNNKNKKLKDFICMYEFLLPVDNYEDSIKSIIKENIEKSIKILEKLLEDINKDDNLIDYARASISQTLKLEFSNQIQPVSKMVESSAIELTQNGTKCFSFKIKSNEIVDNGEPVFFSSPYERAYLIDDPFILDDLPMRTYTYSEMDAESSESYLVSRWVLSHGDSLKRSLKLKQMPTVFEETVLSKSLANIKGPINQVLPGEFEFRPDGEYYVTGESKLRLSNLATGSKMFSILKMLLLKGEINDATMLILDEPEAHLHPQWQNRFAEIIVLLVKELNANILLTTHSPNFMLAIDAYMRKHDIQSKTNFYQTLFREDGFVDYKCVNDDMGVIYADFMQYLSEVKAIRDIVMEKNEGRGD